MNNTLSKKNFVSSCKKGFHTIYKIITNKIQSILTMNERLFGFLLLIFSIITFTLLYFNRAATDVEGWDSFCTLLMKNGKHIYSDFFYYIPPLYLIKHYILWFVFKGSILPIRLFGILDRALLFSLIYLILTKWFKPRIALIASMIGFLLYNSLRFNSYGDYTQFCQLMIIISVYFAIKFSEAINLPGKRKYVLLFTAGFFATQSLMTKQSIGLIFLAFDFIILIIYSLIYKQGKKTWLYLVCALSSFIAGLLPYLIWFTINHSLIDFFTQTFFSSLTSKGINTGSSSFSSTSAIVRVTKSIFHKDIIFLWIFSFTAYIFYHITLKLKSRDGKKSYLYTFQSISMISLLLAILKILDYLNFHSFFINTKNIVRLLFQFKVVSILIFILIVWIVFLFFKKKPSKYGVYSIIAGVMFCGWIIIPILTSYQSYLIETTLNLESFLPNFFEVMFNLCNIFIIMEWINFLFIHKTWLPTSIWFFIIAADANAFVSLFGGGSATFAANGALFTIPIGISIISLLCNFTTENKFAIQLNLNIKKLAIIISCFFIFLLSLVTMSFKFNAPYSWWGWTSEPITDANSYTINLDRYKGMLVSKKTKITLEEVTKLIEKNTDTNDFVFSFPYSKIYNILSNRIEMPTVVPVYFFDVCPDDYAINDLKIIKNNMPKIIVWKDLGEDCWRTYEIQYRNGGRLGQREIQAWYNSVRETQYTLIGKVYNLSIYKLNDGTPVNYTYFSNSMNIPSNINEVTDNINKSDIFSLLFSNTRGRNTSNFYIYAIVFSIILFIYSFSCNHWWKWWYILAATFLIIFKVPFVAYFICILSYLFIIFETKLQHIFEKTIFVFMTLLNICAVFQWNKMIFSKLQYVMIGICILIYLLLILEGIISNLSKLKKK